ncbi:smad nuclear-interacting protein 1 [Spea bombifrons]|uniref:smad nuclear-interacting protein 1 n=1 Tax=Spea bombifrons TaxID=233779 RepID=UPI002349FAF4|nr:smad nuclear-interacting protein 1 [Spea bombifrons]
MKELRDEERRRKHRPRSPQPTSVKQERVSPARPHRQWQSRSPSSSGEECPSQDQLRRRSRSPLKRKNKSSGKPIKSPKYKRNQSESRSPPHIEVKVKQEKQEHSRRAHEERQPRERCEEDHRRNRHRDQTDRGRYNHSRSREWDREERHMRDQRTEREIHNERRRERRQREEQEGESEQHDTDNTDGTSNKEKPNFELSGALVEDTNTFRGVVIKYNEPPEARIPKKRWRLYPFKNDEALPVMYIHRQSAYLLGRQRRIADIPIDHPSCSKQHAVLQYRMVAFTRADGTAGRRVRPYIIDLGSGNGTYLNNQRIEPQRYYELKEKDVLKFGFSSREYVVLHESSDTSEVDKQQDDDDEEDEGTDS